MMDTNCPDSALIEPPAIQGKDERTAQHRIGVQTIYHIIRIDIRDYVVPTKLSDGGLGWSASPVDASHALCWT